MSKPTAQERRTLEVFFQCAAPQLGLYDRTLKCLRDGADAEGLYTKNLELLRGLVTKNKLEYGRIEKLCRFCLREKRQVLWINEILPDVTKDYESLDRNLLGPGEVPIHRLLTHLVLPVSTLQFGAAHSTSQGDVLVTKRECFTMDELINFFCDTFLITRNKQIEKPLVGALNYLLGQYTLDAMLFAIDFASTAETPIRAPLALQDRFLPQAQDHVDLRKARR